MNSHRPHIRQPRLRSLYVAACLAAAHLGSGAAPQGPTVVFGQATVQANGLGIQQGTNKAVIDWNSFSIASGETLRIAQPGANAVLLNRVTGVDPSLILGRIEANGRVFLSNPRGIVLGAGSVIDTGSFLATTLKIDTQDFLADRIQLHGDDSAGSLRADGTINALGGTIALVAPNLSVSGTLSARRIGLAAASSVLVDVEGDGLIFFNARNDGLQARLDMLGTLKADGGTAELRAQARAGFADTVLNMDGIVQARSLGLKNGKVVIDGGSEGVTVLSGRVDVSGAAEGERGGSATVLGNKLALLGTAGIDASGSAGGGEILVGGGFHGQGTAHNAQQTYLGARSWLRADALVKGDGGRIAVWSDDATRFFGQLSARGGAQGGNGGFAEVSGKGFLDFSGMADLSAAKGLRGVLLLDPRDLDIVAANPNLDGSGATVDDDLTVATLNWYDHAGVNSVITAGAVATQLATADVVLEATRDITVSADIAPAPAPWSLTLKAGDDIAINAKISLGGNLSLLANQGFVPPAPWPGPAPAPSPSPATGRGGISFGAGAELSAADITISATGAIVLPKTTASGKIQVTASDTTSGAPATGSIAQGGVLSTGADGSLFTAPGDIDLSTQTNLFGGRSAGFSSSGNVLVTADQLKLGASTIGGTLSATSTAGDLTQGGTLVVSTTGSSFTAQGTGNSIDLSSAPNQIAGLDAGGVSFSTPLSLSLRNVGDIAVPVTSLTGKLVLISDSGSISQTAAFSVGADGSRFVTSTAGQTITLTEDNLFNGHGFSVGSTGAAGHVEITADALLFDSTTSIIGGHLIAIAKTGDITQSGKITTGASGSSFTAQTAARSIDLSSAANELAGLDAGGVSFSAPQDLSVRNVGDIRVPVTSQGGKLVLISDSGSISQTAAFSVGADGSSFTTSAAAQTITLTQANTLNGWSVALNTGATGGNASITTSTGDLMLATSHVGGTLTALASDGDIRQSGAITTGTSGSSFTAAGANHGIDLSGADNSLAGLAAGGNTFSTQLDLALRDIGSIQVPAGAASLNGKLDLTSTTGSITQAGAFSVGADGSRFITLGSNQTITLNAANVFNGKDARFSTSGAAGHVGITGDALKFQGSTIGGHLVAVASTGTISQSGALNLGADGNRFTTSANDQTITLNAANVFNGKDVYFRTNGGAPANVQITGDALKFDGVLIAGHLIATASTGGISQSAALDVASHGSVFTTSTADQTIVLGAGNVFNDKTVAFNTTGSGGDVTFNASLMNFAASSIGGKLVATASAGTISQVGALNVGADGSSFTTSNANQAITLNQANVFNGKTVALSTNGATGDATLSGDGLKFATTGIGGKLVATASTGGISQTGVITVGANGSEFTTSTAGQAITLGQNNVFNSRDVALHSAGDATLVADAIQLNASTVAGKVVATANTGSIGQSGVLSVGADGNSFSTSGAAQTITLTQANSFNGRTVALNTGASGGNASITTSSGALVLGTSNVGGTLTALASNGAISQTGAITTHTAGSSFTAAGATHGIDLSTQNNSLAGLPTAADTFSSQLDLALRNVGSIQLPAGPTTLNGKLVLTSTTGSITQAGAFSVGADGSAFTTLGANQTITLNAANLFNGHDVRFSTTGTGGNVGITGDALVLGASTLGGRLIATANTGAITQTGALNLGANGSDFITGGSNAVTLTQANVLNGRTVALHSGGDATLTADAIALAASTVGGKLVATASTGAITQTGAFSVNADGSDFTTSTAGQAITLGQANVLNGKTIALHSGADATLTADAIKLAASTVAGKLTATASTGAITQTGVLSVNDDGSDFSTSTAGQAITLTQANLLNGKTVALHSGGNASLTSAGAIKLAASTVGGSLVATASSGSITQTGAFSVNADGSDFTTSGSNAVTLTQANVLNGRNIALHSGGDASLTSAGAITLAASTVGGKLMVTANTGSISQTAAFSVGADGSDFTTLTAGQGVTLTQSNVLNGKSIAFHTGSANLLSNAGVVLAASTVSNALGVTAANGSITQAGAISTGTVGSVFNAQGAGHGIDLSTHANTLAGLAAGGDTFITQQDLALRNVGNVQMPSAASSLPGKLVLISDTGSISQLGAFSVGADGSSFSGQTIALTQANVLNGKTVTLTSTGDAALTADSIKLAASTVGGKLTAVASAGGITQTGALSVNADGSHFTGQTLALTQANLLNGKTVALTSTGDAALTADAIKLAASTVGGKLTAVASSGGITQTGALSVNADGSSFSGQTLALTQANVLNGKTVALASTGDAALTADSIKLAASTVGGKLTAIASTGGITQTGALSVNADGSSFSGQTLALTQANVLNGNTVALTSTGDAALTADAIKLAASTVGGKLTAVASTGGITQTGALSVNADGSSFSGQTLALTQANVLNGKTVALASTGDAALTADAIKLAASTIGGKLTAVASTGGITQTGALSVNADGSSFSGTTLALTQANLLGGKTVALTSTGDAALTADAIQLAASTIGGKLTATATGAVTQSGALSVNADGSAISGQTIALTQANVLNGKTIALTSSGDAALTADAIKLAASTIGGKLSAVASTGAITQTGALSVNADGSSFSGTTLTLTQANVLNGKTVALASTGDAALSADTIKLAASTIGGKLSATASSGGISQTGALTVNADGSSFSGTTLALTQANILNGKTVTLTSTGDAALTADAIKLAASTIGGALSLQADTGITQSGALAVTGLTTLTAASSATTATLTDTGNQFSGGVHLARLPGTAGITATLASSNALSISGEAAQLSLSSAQGISQGGALKLSGLLTLAATGAGAINVDLSTSAANELHSVSLAATGPGFATVRLADADTRADGLQVSGNAAQLLVQGQGGVTLAGGQYGSLSVAGSSIQQSGALSVSGATQLNAGSGDITLDLAANDFATLALLGTRRASLADANDLTLTQAQASETLTLSVPGTVQFSGGFTGGGALIKQGTGTLLVSSALANLGGTELQAGTTVLAGPDARLGAGTLALGAASTLELRDGAIFSNALRAEGGLIRSGSGTNRMDGALTLAANTTLEVATGASLRLTGAVSETGGAKSLSKTGAGQLTLSGSDSRSGATRVDQGLVIADGAGSLSAASALSVAAGATLRLGREQAVGSLSGSGAVELATYLLAAGADNSASTFAGSLSGTGALAKTGSGMLTLSGSNSQTGTTLLQAGTLTLAGGQAQADSTAITVSAGATLALAADETLGGLNGSGSVTLGNQRLSINTAGQDAGFTGAISGNTTGAVSKLGTGTQTLAGTGSWGGETRVEGGRLQLASSTALPMGNSVSVSSGATLALRDALTLRALAGAGTVLVDNAALLSLGASDASSQFAGSLQGSGGLAKIGSGSLTLSGTNSFTGPVSVSAGTLVLAGGSALADSSALSLASGATLNLQASETLARLSGQGQVQLDNAARLSLGNDNADTLFAGSINGSGSLAKQGSGTLTLSGSNTYSGGTVIEAGTLQVGNGAASGSLGTGAVDNRGLLRFARSGDSTVDNAISGSGALEQTLGKLTLSSTANTYTGATTVSAGSLATSGAERLPDATALKVLAGASLALAGNETLGSIAADGTVTVAGNVTTTGAQRYGAGLTINAAAPITLQAGGAIEATHASNQLGSQALNLRADSIQLRAPQDLLLGTVQLAQGGQISAEHLALQGALTLNGGTLSLVARAAPDDAKAQAPGGSTVPILPGTDRPLAFAEATLRQAEGSSLTVAAGATLNATALGSIDFNQSANQVVGGLSLLSGAAFDTAWTPNVKGAVGIQSRIRLAGQALNIAGAGMEADLIEISAAKLATVGDAQITARLPYDNVASGTTLSLPGLTLNLLPGAFGSGFSFGSSGDAGIRVSVGSRETGNRTSGPDSGFLTVLPLGGAQGSTAIFLLGPAAGSGLGYSLFHDGSGKQSEVPVFYNNVLPAVPQLTSALSSVTAVSESSRRDRFEEAVRTENVTVRLRAGVIAEVGPGRAATTGSGGVQAPPQCETLDCAP